MELDKDRVWVDTYVVALLFKNYISIGHVENVQWHFR